MKSYESFHEYYFHIRESFLWLFAGLFFNLIVTDYDE